MKPRPKTGGHTGAGAGHGGSRHVARKRFGQHFLTDLTVIDEIVRAIHPSPDHALVEIGPGLGALTNPVVALSQRLTVVELDRDLAQRLRRRSELQVVEADVLKVDFRALAASAGQPLRVIGNLPYNISSPILFHLLDFIDCIADQHFMLQKEVVDRIVAEPGGRAYGRISVMLQAYYQMENVCEVPPEAFDPPPQVDSAVIRMVPLRHTQPVSRQLFGTLVAVAFSQRRKLLKHSLGTWLSHQRIDTGFDLQRRAEEVPVDEFLSLAAQVDAARSGAQQT